MSEANEVSNKNASRNEEFCYNLFKWRHSRHVACDVS